MTSWTRCTLRFTDADNRTQPAARQSRVEVDAMPGKGGDHGRPGRQQRMQALILASLPTGPFADALKTRDILADKGFLLRDRPAFQLALTLHRFFGRVELFGIYDPDGSSGGGIACAVAGIVRVFSCGEIFGVADVQRSVSTAGDMDPSHWTTMSSSRGAAQDLDWAFGRGPFDSPLRGSLRAFDIRRRQPSRGRRALSQQS